MKIYENEHYSVTASVEKNRVCFYAYHNGPADYVYIIHYGYREPETTGWWFWKKTQMSIQEAAMAAINSADNSARVYVDTQEQLKECEQQVTAMVEIFAIVGEI